MSSFLKSSFPSFLVFGLIGLISGRNTRGLACAFRSSALPSNLALDSLVNTGVWLSGASYWPGLAIAEFYALTRELSLSLAFCNSIIEA